MGFLRLMRYCRGSVRLEVSGGFVERFVNLCARNGIHLWENHRTPDGLSACAYAGDYRRMRPLARRAGVRMRLCEKSGAPFVKRRYRHRRGLLAGLCCFILFLGVMSQFVWEIEVRGLETIPELEVLESLQNNGVKEGAFIPGLNTRIIESQMLLDCPGLSWAAINLKGSTAVVEVRERRLPPDPVDDGTPCNIVAAKTGQILKLQVFEGMPLCRQGDAVRQGQALVSGITLDSKNRAQLKHARASVLAQVQEEQTFRVPLTQQRTAKTGEVLTRRYLLIFSLELPLFLAGGLREPYERQVEYQTLRLFSLALPLKLKVETNELVRQKTVHYTEEEALELARQQALEYERQLPKDVQILSRQPEAVLQGEEMIYRVSYQRLEEIALQQKILME